VTGAGGGIPEATVLPRAGSSGAAPLPPAMEGGARRRCSGGGGRRKGGKKSRWFPHPGGQGEAVGGGQGAAEALEGGQGAAEEVGGGQGAAEEVGGGQGAAEEFERMKTLLEKKEAELEKEEEKTADMRKIYQDNLQRLARTQGRLESRKEMKEAEVQNEDNIEGIHKKQEELSKVEGKKEKKGSFVLAIETKTSVKVKEEREKEDIKISKVETKEEICEEVERKEEKATKSTNREEAEKVKELKAVTAAGRSGRSDPRIVEISSDEEGAEAERVTEVVVEEASKVVEERREVAAVTPPPSQPATKTLLPDLTIPPPTMAPHLAPLLDRPPPSTSPRYSPLPITSPLTTPSFTTAPPSRSEAAPRSPTVCSAGQEEAVHGAPPSVLLRASVSSCTPNFFRGRFSLTEADLTSVTFLDEGPAHRNFARKLSSFLQLPESRVHDVVVDNNDHLVVTFRNKAELDRACRGYFAASCDTLEKIVQSRRRCTMERVASRRDGSEAYILTLTTGGRLDRKDLDRKDFARWEKRGLRVSGMGVLVRSKALLVTVLRDAEVRARYPSIQLHSLMFKFQSDEIKDTTQKMPKHEVEEKKEKSSENQKLDEEKRENLVQHCVKENVEKELKEVATKNEVMVRSILDEILELVGGEKDEEQQEEMSEYEENQEGVSQHEEKREEEAEQEEKVAKQEEKAEVVDELNEEEKAEVESNHEEKAEVGLKHEEKAAKVDELVEEEKKTANLRKIYEDNLRRLAKKQIEMSEHEENQETQEEVVEQEDKAEEVSKYEVKWEEVAEQEEKTEEAVKHEEKQEEVSDHEEILMEVKHERKQEEALENEEKENEVLVESLVEDVLDTGLENLFKKEELDDLNVEENNKVKEEGRKVQAEINVESSEDEVEVLVKPKKGNTGKQAMMLEDSEERIQAKEESKAVVEKIVDELLDTCVVMMNEEVEVLKEHKTKKGKKMDKNNNRKKKARFML